MSKTADRIRTLLEALGSTREEVTESLRKLDIRGERGVAARCPLANYLRFCEIEAPRVGTLTAWDEADLDTINSTPFAVLPEPCFAFRRAFDTGAISL